MSHQIADCHVSPGPLSPSMKSALELKNEWEP